MSSLSPHLAASVDVESVDLAVVFAVLVVALDGHLRVTTYAIRAVGALDARRCIIVPDVRVVRVNRSLCRRTVQLAPAFVAEPLLCGRFETPGSRNITRYAPVGLMLRVGMTCCTDLVGVTCQ